MNTNQCCVFIYTYEKSIQIYITYIGINEYRMNRTDERMPKKLKFTLNAHQRKENKKKQHTEESSSHRGRKKQKSNEIFRNSRDFTALSVYTRHIQ